MRKEAMKKMAVFRDLNEEMFPIYQRLVFNGTQNVDRQHILIDYVELNELMPQTPELVVINEISEVFILFGLATLYSCACPIVPLVTMIHNLIDINFSLFVNYTTTRRPIAQLATNIHPWLSIAEFMAFAAVISNCLLLYFSTPVLKNWVEA
jgi:Calcium-activated chloride channel